MGEVNRVERWEKGWREGRRELGRKMNKSGRGEARRKEEGR